MTLLLIIIVIMHNNNLIYRELLAICYSGVEATIELWDVQGMQCEKTLTCHEVASKEYISASFSAGNKMLVAQGGAPDWTMALFLVEKAKVWI